VNTYVAVDTVLPAAAWMIGFSRIRTSPTRRVDCITRRSYLRQTHSNLATTTQHISTVCTVLNTDLNYEFLKALG